MFLYPSGNRDEREFTDPDRFDIHRNPPRILTFGHGIHRCLGAHFAEMEGKVLLEEVLRRIPTYEVDEPGIRRERTDFIHGMLGCPYNGDRRSDGPPLVQDPSAGQRLWRRCSASGRRRRDPGARRRLALRPLLPDLRADSDGGPCFEGWVALAYLAGRAAPAAGRDGHGQHLPPPGACSRTWPRPRRVPRGGWRSGSAPGWNEEERDAYGIPLLPPRRSASTSFDEACEVAHGLLTQDHHDLRGRHYQLENARCEPKPVQRPRPPLVIGGQGDRLTLRITARWADDWNFPGGTPEQFAHKRKVLHEHCAELGRDPAQITCSTHVIAGPEPQRTAEQAAAFAAAGAGHLCLYFFDCSDPGLLGRTADAVLASL